MLITNQVSKLLFSKEKDHRPKIITYSEHSTLKDFHQLQEEFHKSKSLSISMPMESSTSLLKTNRLETLSRFRSAMTKEDFLKIKLKDLLNKHKNSRMLIKKLERELI